MKYFKVKISKEEYLISAKSPSFALQVMKENSLDPSKMSSFKDVTLDYIRNTQNYQGLTAYTET